MNRATRRKHGNVKPRNRLRGSVPPHPLGEMVIANRIVRQAEQQRKREIARATADFEWDDDDE